MKLPSFPLVVLDTETTGFVPRVHKVIEFASMRLEKGKVVDEYEELLYAKEVPAVVEVLTRIKTADVVGKPPFEERRERIIEAIGPDTLIVGQNVGFDIGMLKGEGIDLSDRPWIDTSMLASLVFPELESYSLGYLSSVLKLDHHPVHRALGDVRATLELLAKCWGRLLELPEDLLTQAKSIMMQSTPGYRALFDALPPATHKKRPVWLDEWKQTTRHDAATLHMTIDISPANDGTITLLEEPLDPTFLKQAMHHMGEQKGTTHWLAVKNIEAAASRLHGVDDAILRTVYPPFLLLDPTAAEHLLSQENFTADEATLAVKLHWYQPRLRADFPLHGGEEAVWNGKVTCTADSSEYLDQFTNPPPILLLDHRQLLRIVADTDRSASLAKPETLHILIDDASMLEDTATRAFGWLCAIDDIRAAAEGNPVLTKFLDVLQLWIEKVRTGHDLHYLTEQNLGSPDARGLREQLASIIAEQSFSPQIHQHLDCLAKVLDPHNLHGRIVWIELRQNGSQLLHAAPEHVGAMLKTALFDIYRTTLLIPSNLADTLQEVLPPAAKTTIRTPISKTPCLLDISFVAEPPLDALLTEPPSGKTIILLSSKGTIENLYVKYAEELEERGITLICQGVSGGQGRMQAEFIAAHTPAIWLLTPWTFEGIELPPHSVEHLVLHTLPFDHPSHPVLSKRAQRYKNSFTDYMLPRLTQRLFRLLRAYCRMRTADGDVRILDERLHSKAYGKTLKKYLSSFTATGATEENQTIQGTQKSHEKKTGKKDADQLKLF